MPSPRRGDADAVAILQPVSVTTSPQPSVVIERRRSYSLRLDELWAYRELFYFLMWRDVKVRYKQTALGAAWAVLQPLLLMVVFTIFLGQLAGVGPAGIPYPVFAFSALVPWMFFSNGLAAAANSLVGSANLVSKIYFPRMLTPVAAACSFLLDFAISFVVLLALMAGYGVRDAVASEIKRQSRPYECIVRRRGQVSRRQADERDGNLGADRT